MTTPDVDTLAQQALKLGLLSESQLSEVRHEMEEAGVAPDQLVMALQRKQYLTPLQTAKLLKGDTEGFFLGGYRLLYRIKAGSFGRVYRADDPGSGMVVAIKVLRRRWSEQQRTIDLFAREGKVGLSLQHNNIVKVLSVDFDQASHQYYIVMEFVEGCNLKELLQRRKTLTPAEALRIVEDTVDGLSYAYSLGVTHRDIKPTNILISTQGPSKLVDFGLADIYTSDVPDDSKVYRTVDYAGLEKTTGVKPGDVRSDIYFLGCTLYEMLTGDSPLFLTPDLKARMKRERFLNAKFLSGRNGQFSPGLVHLVDTMMALNPQHRYQTPSQLIEAVREVQHDLGANTDSAKVAKPRERSVFVVEKNSRLQDALRESIRKLGYRVFLSSDTNVALTRFRQSPFDAVLLDAGSTGQESLRPFEQILAEAARKGRPCVGILLLSRDQSGWAKLIPSNPAVTVMVRPVTLSQVTGKLSELVPPRS